VLASGERDGYYTEFARDPVRLLARCLAEGFAFQGEASAFRAGEARGEPSAHLPPAAFMNFLQTHDQVGNRAFGERLCHLASPAALEAVTAVLLLAPAPPFLFMGEEFAADQPFLFFCNFGADLAQAITDGRRREFASFERFADPAALESIPDPSAPETFVASVLDWSTFSQPKHLRVFDLYRRLLALRRERIVPRLAGMGNGQPQTTLFGENALGVSWRLADGSRLSLTANLGNEPAVASCAEGELIYASTGVNDKVLADGQLPPWSVAWHLCTKADR
jgi:1,4-alpha-glucan branching enzyme